MFRSLLASGPAVTINLSALDLFVVGTDNRLYRKSATDGALVTGWTSWRLLPPDKGGEPRCSL